MINEIRILLKKDVISELKQKNNLSIILLYSITTIFLIYMLFTNTIDTTTWNALYWIVSLFATTTAISKSFAFDSGPRQLYMYTLVSPQSIIISKIIFNSIFMSLLASVNLIIFIFIFNKLPEQIMLYCLVSLLGIVGLSVVMTMVSAIANRTNNNFLLMSVLGFPIIIPLLLSVTKACNAILIPSAELSIALYILVILFLIIASVLLSFLLFPYIWRD